MRKALSGVVGVVVFLAVQAAACTGDETAPEAKPNADGGVTGEGGITGGCSAGALVCVGPVLRRCKDDGTGLLEAAIATCASEGLCNAGKATGACAPPACAIGEQKCGVGADYLLCLPDRTGFTTEKAGTCVGDRSMCFEGQCVVCIEGASECVGTKPRKCVNQAWVDGTACTGNPASVCALGECIDSRVARWTMPNEPATGPNPAKYTVSASGNIVRDDVTGLEWTKTLGPAASQQVDQTYCESLKVDGTGGWHMPSIIELLSLMDYSRPTPFINLDVFPGSQEGLLANGRNNASQTFNFVNYATGFLTTESVTGIIFPVRCVRPTKPVPAGPRFTVTGTGAAAEAKDNYTGLTWPVLNTSIMNNFNPALARCVAPYRMPTVKELFTLIDPTKTDNALIDALFSDARVSEYWSLTGGNGSRFVVDFRAPGGITLNSDTNGIPLRCVK